jgi:DNA-binding GntR family transcriptional regulator
MFDPTGSESPKQLRDWVEEQLREAILSGVFESGTWLRQQHLADELGVSQMPIREALKELAAQGLVEHVPYRGMRVVAFSPDDVVDLYAHRGFLEGRAAAAAAAHVTLKTVAGLRRLLDEMEGQMAPEDLDVYRDLNRRFHAAVFEASRRPYLIRTLRQMWEAFPTMLWSTFPDVASSSLSERDSADSREHRAILAALARGDAEEAERRVREHIEAAGRQLVSFLRSREMEGLPAGLEGGFRGDTSETGATG